MQTLKNISASTLETFVKGQNCECIDFADGVLLDNVVYSFSLGTLFCFEQYLNECSSGYTLYFFHKDRARGLNKMWDRFNSLKVNE